VAFCSLGRLAGALLFGMTWFWTACLILLVDAEWNEVVVARGGVVDQNRTHPSETS